MKLIIGLGNPGGKYKNNRHNAGFMVVDKLSTVYRLLSTDSSKEKWELHEKLLSRVYKTSENVLLAKPETFMNDSGKAVANLANWFKVTSDNLYLVYDDLDIRLGEWKISKGKGPRIHNGVNSVEESLGTSDFWHVRIGVDNRDLTERIPGQHYVLQDFTKEEQAILESVLANVAQELKNAI